MNTQYINMYTKDQWYVLSSGRLTLPDNSWYIKFREVEEDIIRSSQYIHNNILTTSNGNFGKIGEYILTEISLNELNRLFPHIIKLEELVNNYNIY